MPQAIVTGPVHDNALALPRDAGRTIEGPGAAPVPAQARPVRRRAVPPQALAGLTAISGHGTGVADIPIAARAGRRRDGDEHAMVPDRAGKRSAFRGPPGTAPPHFSRIGKIFLPRRKGPCAFGALSALRVKQGCNPVKGAGADRGRLHQHLMRCLWHKLQRAAGPAAHAAADLFHGDDPFV